MGNVIHLLRLEHGNAARLLDAMDGEARAMSAGEPVDLELVRLAVEYFAHYPDACHHPKEELVARHLQRRRANLDLARLTDEHDQLSAETARLSEAIDSAGEDGSEPLALAIATYCSHYRAHMEFEEGTLFPAALASLDDVDWAEIDFDLFDRDDPLFDHALEDRYAKLRTAIGRRGERDHEARSALEETRWLEGNADTEAFNARMRALGRDLTLVTFADASYGIERGGSLVARIPPCSPARAAWCAFFYWKGVEGA